MGISEHTAGVGDAAMLAATGRLPDEWFALLDDQQATTWTHTQIASWLHTEHDGLDGWWAQSVTVRYEQARGMRLPGQQADGTFSVSASKSLPLEPGAALDAAVATVSQSLGVRPVSDNRGGRYLTARWRLDGGESLLAQAGPARNGKCTLSLTRSRIADAAAAADAKDTLGDLLAKLVKSLD